MTIGAWVKRRSSESLMMLRELNGHEVHTAYGGFEAIEAAAKLQPDVILMGHQPMFLWILMALLRRQTHGTISLIAQTSQERFSNTKKETS